MQTRHVILFVALAVIELVPGTVPLSAQFFENDSLIIDQKLSNQISVDSMSDYSNGAWVKFKVPYTLHYPGPYIGSFCFGGAQKIISNEKFRLWIYGGEVLQDVLNHRVFTPEGTHFRDNLVSQFNGMTKDIIIKVDLIDLPGTTGGTIQFRDPWYIDYADPAFNGKWRNRGMDSAQIHNRDVGSGGFRPDTIIYTEGPYPYNGVFLGLGGAPNWIAPYYSIAVPQVQNLGGTGGQTIWCPGPAIGPNGTRSISTELGV